MNSTARTALRLRVLPAALIGTVLTTAACRDSQPAVEFRRQLTPHQQYFESLRQAGLHTTALAVEWIPP